MDIQYLKSKNNLSTVLVNGYLLHSKYNPIREAETYYKEKYNGSSQITILFGIGLGYFVLEILKHQENLDNIIIIDPLYEELNPPLPKNVEVVTNICKENIQNVIRSKVKYYDKSFNVFCSPNYDKLFTQEYKIVLESIKDVQMINLVTKNTIEKYSEEWQRNNILNIYNLTSSCSLSHLYKKYDLPVVVASGGPSLTKQLNTLKQYRNRLIIIAAGSTINTLMDNQISPDYVVSIDGGISNYTHFEHLESENLNLIYNLDNHYKIAAKPFNSKYAFILNREVQLQKYLKDIYKVDLPAIQGGSSVAVFALNIANYISSGPIALIGQDLAYTDLKTHAEGNKGFNSVDESYIERRGLFKTEGYSSGEVYTDYAFFAMKQDFEIISSNLNNNCKLYNCTEGGLKINGFINKPFKAFLEKYSVKEKDERNLDINPENLKFDNILNNLLKEKDMYYKLIKKLSQAVDLLIQNKNNQIFPSSLLKKLDLLDKDIKLLESTLVYNILQPLILKVMTEYKEKNINKENEFSFILRKNIYFYSEILRALKFSLEQINNLIENLRGEI